MNKAKPTITWLGGRFWIDRARLTKSNTMTILVNEVRDITIAGANERIVTRKRIIRERLVSLGPFASFTLIPKFGMGILGAVDCANISPPEKRKSSEIAKMGALITHIIFLCLFSKETKIPALFSMKPPKCPPNSHRITHFQGYSFLA